MKIARMIPFSALVFVMVSQGSAASESEWRFFAEGPLSTFIFEEFKLFLIPAVMGLAVLDKKHLMLFLPWLVVAFLLTQEFFTQDIFTFRFGWNTYVPIAILTALGAGFLRKNNPVYYSVIVLLGISVAAGFIHSAQSIHPVITLEEWDEKKNINH